MTTPTDTFLTGTNAVFVAELYERFHASPDSVDPSWAAFFAELGDEVPAVLDDYRGASWAPSDAGVIGRDVDRADGGGGSIGAGPPTPPQPFSRTPPT